MKAWQTGGILAAAAAVVAMGFLWSSSQGDSPKQEKAAKPLVSRKVAKTETGDRTTAVKVRTDSGFGKEKGFGKFDDDWGTDDMSMSFGGDFGFADEVQEKLEGVIREIYSQYLTAERKGDRKQMLASIQKLLARVAAGEVVPKWLKGRLVENIKWVGGSALPEMMAMAADPDVEISKSALEALQEMLWDFDANSQQISDALLQVVKLTNDAAVIEQFIFEMNDMPNQLKVDTALAVIDSGNETAVKCLGDSLDFVFEDFEGKLQTREDIVKWATDRGLTVTQQQGAAKE